MGTVSTSVAEGTIDSESREFTESASGNPVSNACIGGDSICAGIPKEEQSERGDISCLGVPLLMDDDKKSNPKSKPSIGGTCCKGNSKKKKKLFQIFLYRVHASKEMDS